MKNKPIWINKILKTDGKKKYVMWEDLQDYVIDKEKWTEIDGVEIYEK